MLIFHGESVQKHMCQTIAISIILEPRHWAYCMDQHRSYGEAMVGDVDKIFFFWRFLWGKVITCLKANIANQKWWMGLFSEAMLVSGGVLAFKSATLDKVFGKVDVNISIAKRYTQQFRKKNWPRISQTFLERIGAEIRHQLRWVVMSQSLWRGDGQLLLGGVLSRINTVWWWHVVASLNDLGAIVPQPFDPAGDFHEFLASPVTSSDRI